MALTSTNNVKDNKFWDSAWTSEKLTKATEILDRFIPQVAVEYSYNLLGDISGEKLLEIGCGSGIQTIEFCKKGAYVTSIDVSQESITATEEICKINKIQNVLIKNMNAESLEFKDETFDKVYISRMLMHTNKDKVLNEAMRVLKKGGILVITEVLKHWIFAFPYRFVSPYKKTNPKYITLQDIKNLKAHHKEFYLLSTFFLFLFYIKINKQLAFKIFNLFSKIDDTILKIFPLVRNFAWTTVAVIRK